MKPTIGRIVIYRTDGRNGMSYDLPAIITCTQDTHPGDYPDGEKNPLAVPSSDTHVHLTVFSPGGFGTTIGAGSIPRNTDAFKGAKNMRPGSGTYVELDVPFGDETTERSWRWPVIQK